MLKGIKQDHQLPHKNQKDKVYFVGLSINRILLHNFYNEISYAFLGMDVVFNK